MKVSHDNIETFIYTPGKYLIIPDFQRPYSWDKANIASFIEDLKYVMEKDINHFFGSIVYINDGHNKTIIDGQQRATTVLLMLTALYHIIESNSSLSNIPAEAIREQYLYNSQPYSEEQNRIKLRTVTTDNEIFELIFEKKKLVNNQKGSKLYQAYEHFYAYFKEKDNLHKYINALSKFEIVTIALDSSDDDPQKIFESINSTGKPLTDGDKIRNFSLMLNNEKSRNFVLKDYWKKIEQELTKANKDYISDFFKYFLISKLCKDIKIEEVYPEFKNLFLSSKKDKKDEIDFLRAFYDEVISFLEHYIFLKFNKEVDNYSTSIKDSGFRLNYLNIETPFPYLMQVLEQYKQGAIDDKEIIKIFRIIESYLARRIICNIPTTGLNKLFSGLHKEIKNSLQQYPDQKYSDILVYIITNKWGGLRMPKTAEIKYAVENNPIYTQRNNYIYFILSSIDDSSKESNLLRQISNGEIELTIEHIMPKSLNNLWKESLGDEYEDDYRKYLHTLPNLTLTGYNSKYSNSDFQAKKSMTNGFNESPLVINKFIKDMENWNRESLKIRSEWWVNQIDELWPIPESSFRPDTKEKELYLMEDNDFSNSKIKDIIILGDSYNCNKWTLAMEIILSKFFLLEDQLYDFIVSDSYLSKYIKAEDNGFRRSSTIEGTRYFYETNLNVNKKRDIIVRLADYLGLEKTDIKVILAD